MRRTRTTRTTDQRDRQLEAIAKTILDIPRLETRHAGELDFHELPVWQIRNALRKTYLAGYEDAVSDLDPERVEPEDGCPRCGETNTGNLIWINDATAHCTNCGTHCQPSERWYPRPERDGLTRPQRPGRMGRLANAGRIVMEKCEAKVGQAYLAKVSDRVVSVRIGSVHSRQGWNATNTATGKRIHIKSAQRLRGPAKTSKKKLAAVAKADQPLTQRSERSSAIASRSASQGDARCVKGQENARLRDERAASADGITASERAMAKSAKKTKVTSREDRAETPATPAGRLAPPRPERPLLPGMRRHHHARRVRRRLALPHRGDHGRPPEQAA